MTPSRFSPLLRAVRRLAAPITQPALLGPHPALPGILPGSGPPRGAAPPGSGALWASLASDRSEFCSVPSGGAAGRRPVRFDDSAVAFAARSDTDLWVANLVLGTLAAPRWFTRLGMRVTQAALAARVPGAEALVKGTVFRVFCGGATLAEVADTVAALHHRGVASILDYAVEGEKTEAGFEDAKGKLIETVQFSKNHEGVAFCALKMTSLAPSDAMARLQAGEGRPEDAPALARGVARLEAIVAEAARVGVPVFIDAEESWIQGTIDQHAERLMREHNRGERPIVFTTIQMYRQDGLGRLSAILDDARAKGYRAGIKLVRGAYVEKEAARARDLGYANPIHPSKAATDDAYDAAITVCLDGIEHLDVCAATHNQLSVERTLDGMASRGIAPGDRRISFAQLLGMEDKITFTLVQHQLKAAKYVPFGPVPEVLQYLDRRAQENKETAGRGEEERDLVVAELQRRRAAKRAGREGA